MRRAALALALLGATLVPRPAAARAEAPAAPARGALAPLPEPGAEVEALTPADQEQLREQRAHLDDLLAGAGVADDELALAYGTLGQLYFAFDFLEVATIAFENAAALQPQAFPWRYYLATLHTAQGALDAAEADLERALEIAPEDLAALVRLGRVRLDRGDVAGAETAFSAALGLDPESAAAHHGMGRVRLAQDRVEVAIAELERALALQAEATSIHHVLGLAYRKQGDLERAKEHLALNRSDPVLFPDPLIAVLDRFLHGSRFRLKAGNDAMAKGDVATAVGHYRQAVEADPDDALAHYNLGFALARQGEEESARNEFRRAIEIDPSFRNAHFNLAASFAREQHWDEAVTQYREALKIDPQDLSAHLELAAALAASDRREEAGRELRSVLETAPEYETAIKARASIQLGRLAELDRRLPEAIEHFRRAVELDPGSITGHRVLARFLARNGRLEEAAAELDRVIELAPDDLEARFGRATALMLDGRDAAARQALESDLAAFRDALPLAHALARLLAASADPEVRDGPRALELALAVHRQQGTLDHAETVAMAYAETGDFAQAVEWEGKVVEQAESAGQADLARAAARRLESYQRGEPVRSPWLGNG
jgi:tetratricopeptide (TPR) repeat protein